MSTTTLVFVRHGETSWNVEGRIQGHIDIALNPLGAAQAEAVGKRLARERFNSVYSSDLVRAYHTARPAVPDPDRTIIKDPRLRERHLGVLQGLTGEEAMAKKLGCRHACRERLRRNPLRGARTRPGFRHRPARDRRRAI